MIVDLIPGDLSVYLSTLIIITMTLHEFFFPATLYQKINRINFVSILGVCIVYIGTSLTCGLNSWIPLVIFLGMYIPLCGFTYHRSRMWFKDTYNVQQYVQEAWTIACTPHLHVESSIMGIALHTSTFQKRLLYTLDNNQPRADIKLMISSYHFALETDVGFHHPNIHLLVIPKLANLIHCTYLQNDIIGILHYLIRHPYLLIKLRTYFLESLLLVWCTTDDPIMYRAVKEILDILKLEDHFIIYPRMDNDDINPENLLLYRTLYQNESGILHLRISKGDAWLVPSSAYFKVSESIDAVLTFSNYPFPPTYDLTMTPIGLIIGSGNTNLQYLSETCDNIFLLYQSQQTRTVKENVRCLRKSLSQFYNGVIKKWVINDDEDDNSVSTKHFY